MRGHRYHDHMVVCMKYERSSLLWSYYCLYEIWGVIITMIIWLSVWNMRGHRYHDYMVVCMKYEGSSLPWSYDCLYEIWRDVVTVIVVWINKVWISHLISHFQWDIAMRNLFSQIHSAIVYIFSLISTG